MRELKVVGLDVDGKRIICETADSGEKFILRPDDRLRAALSGDRAAASPTQVDVEVPNVLTPQGDSGQDPRGRIRRAGRERGGRRRRRVERFAHPVLLERSRAAELATAAHPVLADGPAVLTLLETVTTALVVPRPRPRRHDVGRLAQRGRPLDRPAGVEGGPVGQRRPLPLHARARTAARRRRSTTPRPSSSTPTSTGPPLRSVAPVPDTRPVAARARRHPSRAAPGPGPRAAPTAQAPAAEAPHAASARPEVPGWEDVLLGVRSGTQP